MTTLDDLRQVLEEDAGLAPDGAGLALAAELGAANLRRRRRLVAVSAAAALVAAIAVVTPIVVHREAGKPVTPVVGPTARKPGDMTLTVDPGVGIPVFVRAVSDDLQTVTLMSPERTKGEPRFAFMVQAWDPNSRWIPKPPQSAEHTTIQGRDARIWFSPRPPGVHAIDAGPIVQWQDPGGLWLAVFQAAGTYDRAKLVHVAEAARLGPPHPVTAPFRLAPLPAGLRLSSIEVDRENINGDTTAVQLVSPGGAGDDAPALRITAFGKGPDWPTKGMRRTPTTPVAGRPAWYSDENPGQSELIVDGGSCWMVFGGPSLVTVEQRRAVAAGTTYGDCDDQSTWTPPLG